MRAPCDRLMMLVHAEYENLPLKGLHQLWLDCHVGILLRNVSRAASLLQFEHSVDFDPEDARSEAVAAWAAGNGLIDKNQVTLQLHASVWLHWHGALYSHPATLTCQALQELRLLFVSHASLLMLHCLSGCPAWACSWPTHVSGTCSPVNSLYHQCLHAH